MEDLIEETHDVIILETNPRMIVAEKVKQKFGFFIQEYVKEHYLEGCKAGFIKPVPLPSNKHILFINNVTKDKNSIITTYLKCLSFAKIVNAKHICFLVTRKFASLHSTIYWWNNISYLDYNFHIDVLSEKYKIKSTKRKIKYLIETGFIQQIYFETFNYIQKLAKDNLLVRNEKYPIIDLNKDDMEMVSFYNEMNFGHDYQKCVLNK